MIRMYVLVHLVHLWYTWTSYTDVGLVHLVHTPFRGCTSVPTNFFLQGGKFHCSVAAPVPARLEQKFE